MEALNKHHAYICTLSKNEAFSELIESWKKMHYPPETTSLQLIIKIFALYKQTTDKPKFLVLLNDFQQKAADEQYQVFHKILGANFTSQLEDLYKGMMQTFSGDADFQAWLTPDVFKTLFVLIGTNGQGIGTTAVGEWAKRVGALENVSEDEKKKLDQAIDDLYMRMDDFVGQFLNVEGSGLYSNQSKINHSCVPNCEIQFPQSNHVLQVTALQKINPGEEITISYLDECALSRSRHSRQKVLKENYMFICQCEKCFAESGQDDRTSSEEEDDEDEDDQDMED